MIKYLNWYRLLSFTALTLACSLLIGLGIWQLQRLEWKTALISDIEAAYAAPAVAFDDLEQSDNIFRRVILQGHYLSAESFFIAPKTYHGEIGSHVITPFQTGRGIVLVNRGWVPSGQEQGIAIDEKRQELIGILRPASKPHAMTPNNMPDRGQWYWPDVEAMSSHLGVNMELATLSLFWLTEGSAASSAPYPVPMGTKPVLKNDHLSYALFWFTMVGILLGITVVKIKTNA